jgi:ferrochelatase
MQGPYIARKRSGRIREQYAAIGGKSPISDWTHLQGQEMVRKLTAMARAAGSEQSYKYYVGFRYAPPLTDEVLLRMRADGVKRAVAFSQYPQFSCTTTGSSLNHLWRESIRLGLEGEFAWSVIDRWHNHPTFISAVARRVALGLAQFPEVERDGVTIVFSAHSIPMMIVNRGDPYTTEIASTADLVMQRLREGVVLDTPASHPSPGESPSVVKALRNPHVLAWQSKVGFLPWMGPSTASVLAGLGRQGISRVLVVPIAFTSDHIETLHEIDLEYAEGAHKAGITQFKRAPSLNDEPLLSTAQAEIVAAHLAADEAVSSPQYALNCAGCVNPACRSILNPAHPYQKRRDAGCVEAESAAAATAGSAAGAPAHSTAAPQDLAWPKAAEVDALRAARTSGPCP